MIDYIKNSWEASRGLTITIGILIVWLICCSVTMVYNASSSEMGRRAALEQRYSDCREGVTPPKTCVAIGVDMTWEVL